VPLGFSVYSGDDLSAVELMLLGAKGNISVTANVVPSQMAELCKFAMSDQSEHARSIQQQLLSLHNALFIEANPIPVKWALARMGSIPKGIRLPLTPLAAVNRELLEKAMVSLSLLSD
jgi:4-hydroxy-tetrahydrodipicolinate synthase